MRLRAALVFALAGLMGCAKANPRLVIKYSHAGKLLEIQELAKGRQPGWSPDGERMVYVNQGIRLQGVDGGEPLKINAEGEDPAFSPDGQQLIFTQNNQIWLLNLNDMQKTLLIEKGRQPAWSPEGNTIVYVADDGIWVYDLALNKAEMLPVKGINPVWSKDGRLIYFESFDPLKLNFNIERYDPDNKKSDQLLYDAVQPDVAKSGNYLYYSSTGIWVLDLQKMENTRLTLYGYEPAVSPDGRRLLFSYNGSIWLMDSPYDKSDDE
ncbi:MAG: PD40 domain-containing protein [Candidatus Schekmanbacteria bacterium]|nr:PD40 domain-containing protein [Candidatus Schekmanbacteria bacterium]